MRDEEFYRPLDRSLDVINDECIAMNASASKLSVEITLKVLDVIINRLKEVDEFFKFTYNRVTYVGSYFDGLRVKEATEFDVNVVINLPVDYNRIEVTRDPGLPGYVKIDVSRAKHTGVKLEKCQRAYDKMLKMVDGSGYLSHECVLRWWESLFSKIRLDKIDINGRIFDITFHKAGPAMTVCIDSRNQRIDVDMVAVIEFNKDQPPPSGIRWQNQEGCWYAVPKRLLGYNRFWRISFPEQEKRIMSGKYYLKMTNRFLKRFRDANNWNDLASYYIKTVFIWEAYEQEFDYHFKKNRGFLLVYFLNKLSSYLAQRQLPFFWDVNMNLLANIKDESLLNYSHRIKRLVGKLERLIEEDRPSELNNFMIQTFYSPDERRSRFLRTSMPVRDSSSDDWELVEEPGGEFQESHPPELERQESSLWSKLGLLAIIGISVFLGLGNNERAPRK